MRGRPSRFQKAAPVGDDRYRAPRQTGIRAQHFGRILGLEFGIVAGVEDAQEDLLHFVGQAVIGGKDAVDIGDVAGGLASLRVRGRRGERAEPLADAGQAIGIVRRHVVRHAARGRVQARAAQRFGVDHLPGRALHEVGAAQPHEAGALHHDDDVAQRGQVGAPGDARPHHGRDLRNPQLPTHERVVIEDAPGAVLAGEDAVLVGEIDARRIHQVDDRQVIAHGDLLRAQDFRDGLGPPGPGLHGGVVGHHYGGTAFDPPDAGDYAGGRRLPLIAIVGDEQADLEEGRTPIEQAPDALARGHLAGAMLAVDAR